MEAQPTGPGVLGFEGFLHLPGPNPPRRSELGYFLEEVIMHVEKEAEPWHEIVDGQTPRQAVPHVLKSVGQRERQLLDSGGTCLAYVVSADADGIPPGHVAGGELHRVHHQTHGRLRREDVLVLGDVFFEDVVLKRAADVFQLGALLLGHHDEHGPDNSRRAVDGH